MEEHAWDDVLWEIVFLGILKKVRDGDKLSESQREIYEIMVAQSYRRQHES